MIRNQDSRGAAIHARELLAREVVVVVNFAGVTVDVDAPGGVVLGHPQDALIGRPIADFLEPESLALALEKVGDTRTIAGRVVEFTLRALDPRGAPHRMACRMRADNERGLLYVAAAPGRADLSPEPSCAELRARASAADTDPQRLLALEALVATLTRELERAREESALRSQRFADMSHELRTPLNAILGYAEILREDLEMYGLRSEVGDVRRLHGAASHLLALVNDILDLSRLDAGKLNVCNEPCSMRQVIASCEATIRPLLDGNELVLSIEDGVDWLETDRTRVRQVLINLLSNACKFTERGRITLSVTRAQEGDARWIRLSVTDTGIGIPASKLSRLFRPFEQVHDRAAQRKLRRKGTGLGLAISQRVCRLLGGDIEVSSTVGVGSTFTLRLPYAPCEPRSTSAGVATGARRVAPSVAQRV